MEETNNEEITQSVEPTTEAGVVEQVSTNDNEPETVAVPKEGTETNEKTMSQDDINKIIKRRVDRALKSERAKYSDLVNTMKAGMGVDSEDEVIKRTKEFYKGEGVEIPETPKYSDEDEKILADHEAKEIISLGEDDIVSTVDDMETRGIDNLTSREKMMYDILKAERTELENRSALHKIGVKDSEIDSSEFKEFAKKFDKSTPLTEVYQMYSQLNEKPTESIGSMQSTLPTDEVKDHYSPEDFDHLTKEQLNNPKIWAKVKESMQKWA
jgi:hypothetical protein